MTTPGLLWALALAGCAGTPGRAASVGRGPDATERCGFAGHEIACSNDEYCVATADADPDPVAPASDRFHCARFPASCGRSPGACECLVDAGVAMSACSSEEAPSPRDARGRRVDVTVVRTARGGLVPLMCLMVPCPDGTYCEQQRHPEASADHFLCPPLPPACRADRSCGCLATAGVQGRCAVRRGRPEVFVSWP